MVSVCLSGNQHLIRQFVYLNFASWIARLQTSLGDAFRSGQVCVWYKSTSLGHTRIESKLKRNSFDFGFSLLQNTNLLLEIEDYFVG